MVHIENIFIKRERERDSEGKATEDRGKDWNDVSTSQGTSRVAPIHQKLEERHETDYPSEAPERITLLTPSFPNSGFQDSERLKPPSFDNLSQQWWDTKTLPHIHTLFPCTELSKL